MAQGQTFSFHTTHTTQLGKKQKLFYTTTPLYLIQRLIRTLYPSITNEQYLNTIAQGSSILEQRKLFLFERCHKVIIEKWILLFKCPMKLHTFFNVAQLFYKEFCSAVTPQRLNTTINIKAEIDMDSQPMEIETLYDPDMDTSDH